MHCTSCSLKRKVGKPLLFKQTLRSRFTYPACQHFRFHTKKSLDRERPFSLALRVVSLLLCLSRHAPSVTRVVICVSRAFCSTDQEKRETARSLRFHQPPPSPLPYPLYHSGGMTLRVRPGVQYVFSSQYIILRSR